MGTEKWMMKRSCLRSFMSNTLLFKYTQGSLLRNAVKKTFIRERRAIDISRVTDHVAAGLPECVLKRLLEKRFTIQ